MTTEVTIDRNELRAVYARVRAHGATVEEAVDAVWHHVRARYLPRARAPYGVEKLSVNTGCRRAYRSPLGDALGITGEFGHHCAKWRRTVRSWRERDEVLSRLAEELGERA